MPARLNRRRYREIVATLKEVIADKKAPQQRRLRAVETLMEVYARHDRSEVEKARRRSVATAQDSVQPTAPEPAPVSREDAVRDAQAFLARIGEKTNATE